MAVLLPHTDYVVESNWNGLGLRGIGADDVVVSGAFVPEHRAFSWLDLSVDDSVPALDRLPQPTLYTLAGTIPLLGAAQRLLASTPDSASASSALAMARKDVELAVLQIRHNVAALMQCVRAGGYPSGKVVEHHDDLIRTGQAWANRWFGGQRSRPPPRGRGPKAFSDWRRVLGYAASC